MQSGAGASENLICAEGRDGCSDVPLSGHRSNLDKHLLSPELFLLSHSVFQLERKVKQELWLLRQGSGNAQVLQHRANLTQILAVWIAIPVGREGSGVNAFDGEKTSGRSTLILSHPFRRSKGGIPALWDLLLPTACTQSWLQSTPQEKLGNL